MLNHSFRPQHCLLKAFGCIQLKPTFWLQSMKRKRIVVEDAFDPEWWKMREDLRAEMERQCEANERRAMAREDRPGHGPDPKGNSGSCIDADDDDDL